MTLTPYKEITSRVISGSVKQSDASTRLTAEGDATRMVQHSESAMSGLIPAAIAVKFADQQLRRQYGEIRDEIIRRKAEAAKP